MAAEIYEASFYMVAFFIVFSALLFQKIDGSNDKPQSRLYSWLLIDVMISSLCGVITSFTRYVAPGNPIAAGVHELVKLFYFVSHTALAPMFLVYVRLVSGAVYRKKTIFVKAYLLFFVVAEALLFTNPFTRWIYTFDEDYVLKRQWGETIIYISSLFYLLTALFHLMKFWYSINNRRRLAMIIAFVMTVVGVVIQLLFQNLNLELAFEALALVGIFLAVEKEDDRVDPEVGTYLRAALRADLDNYFKLDRSFEVLCLRVTNCDAAASASGIVVNDEIMRMVAQYLQVIARSYQIYRSSANSFMILYDRIDREPEMLIDRFSKQWLYNGNEIYLSMVILSARVPGELSSAEEIMLLADADLPDEWEKRLVHEPLNAPVIRNENLALIKRERLIAEALKRCIADNDFQIYYQPVYRISDRNVVAAEVTLRMNDDDLGEVLSEEFMPIVVEQGMTSDMGNFLIDRLCLFLSSGIPTELGLKFINMSLPSDEIMEPDFIKTLMENVKKYEVEPSNINISVYETYNRVRYEQLEEVLKRLKDIGFRLSIEGYGTGYANLFAFFDLGFDEVHIDTGTMLKQSGKERNLTILRNSIYMIKEMKREILVKTIAGLKDIEEMEKLGADYFESSYYSDAVSQNEFISILRITESARMDEQRARAGSEAKSSFLANMSHEIRTPINVILGMNEMILRESVNDTVIGYARDIENAGRGLLALINDILDFSKIEAGSMEINEAEYELGSLIRDVASMITVRNAESPVEFKLSVDEKLPKKLYGDELRIRQILLNLLGNAYKYTKQGFVKLTVRGKVSGDGIRLKFLVTDTGMGIKKSDMGRLFGTFQRLDMDKNKTVEGTGLGLAITRNLLSLMNGKIDVESEYGKGSKFIVILPQKIVDAGPVGEIELHEQKREDKSHGKDDASFTAKNARILCVDDTSLNLKVIERLLARTGLTIDTAISGEEGLKLIEKSLEENKLYDLVLLDYRMPVMDGVEALKRIKAIEDERIKGMPVIVLTANAISGAREKFLEDGFDDYLTKPVEPKMLESVILKYLPPEKIDEAGTVHTEENKPDKQTEPLVRNSGGLIINDVLPQGLYEIPGLDVNKGLELSGDAKDYMEFLSIFDAASDTDKQILIDLQSAGNVTGLKGKLHSLKSTLGVIGATELSKEAGYLENEGTAYDMKGRLDKFVNAFTVVAEGLKKVLHEEEDEASKKSISESTYAEALFAIKACAADMDYETISFMISELKSYSLDDEKKAMVDELDRLAAAIDWTGIETLLADKGGVGI
ncbi:MAG: EAL domain-containing protein [Lachnospiraceae bacterium]|nr:EAL domain-containing protein [Lachnospiraceae bacterium]